MSTPCFQLEFDPLSARHGWMKCWLVLANTRYPMHASSVFSPFKELLRLARALAADRLPHEYYWEQEGPYLEFKALPISPGHPRFRLQLQYGPDEHEAKVELELDRLETARGLLEAIRGVAMDCPGAESEWEFPYFLIEDFERDLARGFQPEADGAPANRARFTFFQCGGYGGVDDPAFSIWLEQDRSVVIMIGDCPERWQVWLEMLEKIQRADFPVLVDFRRASGDADPEESEPDSWLWRSWFYFSAESVEDPEQFRLKIEVETDLFDERQNLCDLIFNRRQFTGAFVSAFRQYLMTDYLGFLAARPPRIDLRSLPLDGLGED